MAQIFREPVVEQQVYNSLVSEKHLYVTSNFDLTICLHVQAQIEEPSNAPVSTNTRNMHYHLFQLNVMPKIIKHFRKWQKIRRMPLSQLATLLDNQDKREGVQLETYVTTLLPKGYFHFHDTLKPNFEVEVRKGQENMFQKAAPSVQKELETHPNVPLFHKDLTEEVEIEEVSSRPPVIQILSDDEEQEMEEVDKNDLDDLPSSGEPKRKSDDDDGDDSNNNGGVGHVGTSRAQTSHKSTQKAQEQP